jgi:hypothetical protein
MPPSVAPETLAIEPYRATKKHPSHRPLGCFSAECCAKNTQCMPARASARDASGLRSLQLYFTFKYKQLYDVAGRGQRSKQAAMVKFYSSTTVEIEGFGAFGRVAGQSTLIPKAAVAGRYMRFMSIKNVTAGLGRPRRFGPRLRMFPRFHA